MGSKGSQAIAPFLRKTYEIIDDSNTNDIISWSSPHGRSFVVWKPAEFAANILPLHFKHDNFSSFVRQLNTYGFRKVESDRWEFANEGFLRGRRDLLASIQRRKPNSSSNNGAAAAQAAAAAAAAAPPAMVQLAAGMGMADASAVAAASTLASMAVVGAPAAARSLSGGLVPPPPSLAPTPSALPPACGAAAAASLLLPPGGGLQWPQQQPQADMRAGGASSLHAELAASNQRLGQIIVDYLSPGKQLLAAIASGAAPPLQQQQQLDTTRDGGSGGCGVDGAASGSSSAGGARSSSISQPLPSEGAEAAAAGRYLAVHDGAVQQELQEQDDQEEQKAVGKKGAKRARATPVAAQAAPGNSASPEAAAAGGHQLLSCSLTGAAAGLDAQQGAASRPASAGGIARPLPQSLAGTTGRMISEIAGQLGALCRLAGTVGELQEETVALRRDMERLSSVFGTMASPGEAGVAANGPAGGSGGGMRPQDGSRGRSSRRSFERQTAEPPFAATSMAARGEQAIILGVKQEQGQQEQEAEVRLLAGRLDALEAGLRAQVQRSEALEQAVAGLDRRLRGAGILTQDECATMNQEQQVVRRCRGAEMMMESNTPHEEAAASRTWELRQTANARAAEVAQATEAQDARVAHAATTQPSALQRQHGSSCCSASSAEQAMDRQLCDANDGGPK